METDMEGEGGEEDKRGDLEEGKKCWVGGAGGGGLLAGNPDTPSL